MSRDAEIGGRVISRLIAELAEQEEAAVALYGRVQELEKQAAESERQHKEERTELVRQIAELRKPPEDPPAGVLAVAK